MLTTAVVAWGVVSVAYSTAAVQAMNTSGGPGGIGDLLVGVAALVAAASSWLNSRKAKEHSAEAVKSLGPANGTTVLELLHEIKGFEEYQHGRNHQVLNNLAELKVSMPILLKVIERLIDKLNETEN